MKKNGLRATARILAGVALGFVLAAVWMGSHPGAADAQCGGTIAVGNTIRGDISKRGTICSYYFDGRANDVVTIRMTRVSSSLDPWSVRIRPRGKIASEIR